MSLDVGHRRGRFTSPRRPGSCRGIHDQRLRPTYVIESIIGRVNATCGAVGYESCSHSTENFVAKYVLMCDKRASHSLRHVFYCRATASLLLSCPRRPAPRHRFANIRKSTYAQLCTVKSNVLSTYRPTISLIFLPIVPVHHKNAYI